MGKCVFVIIVGSLASMVYVDVCFLHERTHFSYDDGCYIYNVAIESIVVEKEYVTKARLSN